VSRLHCQSSPLGTIKRVGVLAPLAAQINRLDNAQIAAEFNHEQRRKQRRHF
jgi:hypothetical protein